MKKLSLETLRNDKRTRSAVIGASVGAVLVLATAVTVPVMLHNRAPVTQAAEPSITVSEPTIAETTAAAPTSEAVTVTTVSETAEPTSAASPMGDSVTEKKEKSKSSAKPSAQGAGNGSGVAAKQPAPNTPPAEPKKPNKKQWTQAEVDALVTETMAYAKSRGFIIDSALTTVGTSWRNPATTESKPERVKQRLTYLIDESYDSAVDSLGYFPENMATINIVTQQYTDSDGYTQWEIYVVY